MTEASQQTGDRQIETPRLRIISFTGAFLSSRYVDWLNDAEVTQFSEQRHRKHTLETCRAYMTSFEGSPNFFWAILRKQGDPAHIGNINAYVDERNSLADVGILVGEKDTWGKGFGGEAWLGVCDFLLRIRAVRKVTAGTLDVNRGMLAIMQRVGMLEDGCRHRHYLWNGQEIDVIHRALFREDWLRRYPRGPFAESLREQD
ncbi:MAG: GNAT family N-acetyltransferase [Phycisphaerae bacterium]|nr:GNAT family N-acetyltransferase [Phycisphaerae bacterium]